MALNLRYLLWREDVKRETWAKWLAERIGCDYCRAEELLRGSEPRFEETERIAEAFSISQENLVNVSMVDKEEVNVLLQNLRRLIDSMNHMVGKERGGQKRLANDLGVHSTTVSRWYSGEESPNRDNLTMLLRYFGLTGIDLETDPTFLHYLPIGKAEQKAWLSERVDGIDADKLGQLFPALERLLSDR